MHSLSLYFSFFFLHPHLQATNYKNSKLNKKNTLNNFKFTK